MAAADGIAMRAERKRWGLAAESDRARLIAAFPELVQAPNLAWCGFDESRELQRKCSELGKDAGRIIQRWDDLNSLTEISENVTLEGVEESCNLLLMDYAKAGWAHAPARVAFPELMHLLPRMTDGFILFWSCCQSILSVDVETAGESRWVETTLIGPGLAGVRSAFAHGPIPLPIFGPGRDGRRNR